MFKEFRCPENTDKVLGAHYSPPDRPKVTKRLMVDLTKKTQKKQKKKHTKKKQQMEFQSFKFIQDLEKVYVRRFVFGLLASYIYCH